MKIKTLSLAVAASSMIAASGAHAGGLDDLYFNGFGTIGVSYMDSEDRSHGISSPPFPAFPEVKETYGQRDNFDKGFSYKPDTKIGGQATYFATDKLSFAAQAKVSAINEEYKARLTWLYGAYQVNNDLKIRAGRLSLPLFLKSDTMDIGYTYDWARPPQELHAMIALPTFEGVDVLYNLDVLGQGVELQAWVGQNEPQDYNFIGNASEVGADETYGISVKLPMEYGYIRAVHGVAKGIDVSVDSFDAATNSNFEDLEGTFTAVGGKFHYGNFDAIGEVALREGPSVGGVSEQEAFYVTTGYQITPKFKPLVSYSRINDKSTDGHQTSISAGIRYDVATGVAIKAQYTAVESEGYTGLFDASGSGGLASYTGALQPMGGPGPDSLAGKADIASVTVDFVF